MSGPSTRAASLASNDESPKLLQYERCGRNALRRNAQAEHATAQVFIDAHRQGLQRAIAQIVKSGMACVCIKRATYENSIANISSEEQRLGLCSNLVHTLLELIILDPIDLFVTCTPHGCMRPRPDGKGSIVSSNRPEVGGGKELFGLAVDVWTQRERRARTRPDLPRAETARVNLQQGDE